MKSKADAQRPKEPKTASPKKGKIRAFLGSTRGQLLSLGLFLAGSFAGAYVEKLAEAINPEFFGPPIEELLEQQQFHENFNAIHEKLAQLTANAVDGNTPLRQEIADLLAEQQEHVTGLQARLASSYERAQKAKDRALQGVAPQADFELETNKAVTVGKRGNVFATLRIFNKSAQTIDVQLNGKKHRMTVGGQIPLVTDEEECVISYVGGDYERKLTHFNMTCNPA
jgi:hypothetical protein